MISAWYLIPVLIIGVLFGMFLRGLIENGKSE